MPFSIACPSCKRELEALDEHAGLRVCCANCNAEFVIPGETRAPHDVMISYSPTDKSIADAACFVLEGKGIRCWIAPRDITPGKERGEANLNAIASCQIMLLIFSSNSDQSQQVRREVEWAVAKVKPIIPFRIENVPPSKSMEYFLSNTHWLDAFTGELEKHLEKMTLTVQSLLNVDEVKAVFVRPPVLGIRQRGGILANKADSSFKFSIKSMIVSVLSAIMLVCIFLFYLCFFHSKSDSPNHMGTTLPETSKSPNDSSIGSPLATSGKEDKIPDGFEIIKASGTGTGCWAPEIRHKSTGIEMVYVAPGEFMMGSSLREQDEAIRLGSSRDLVKGEVLHRVILTKGYYIGKYEVTQLQWEKLTGKNPSHFTDSGENAPVENISWEALQSFRRIIGNGFRLPTEAEWEYAARGGSKSKEYTYSGSNNLDEVGWDSMNSMGKTHPVGQKKPNEIGLHDMSGNVFEWCSDGIRDYQSCTETDPSGGTSDSSKIIRGGGCLSESGFCRSTSRYWFSSNNSWKNLGIRLVVSAD